jgi:hypothetical protein
VAILGTISYDIALAKLRGQLGEVGVGVGSTVVFDPLGNLSYRLVQSDGGLALPICLGGRLHMLGGFEVIAEKILRDVVSKLMSIFNPTHSQKGHCPPSL